MSQRSARPHSDRSHLTRAISPFWISSPVIYPSKTPLPALKYGKSPIEGTLGVWVWPQITIRLCISIHSETRWRSVPRLRDSPIVDATSVNPRF